MASSSSSQKEVPSSELGSELESFRQQWLTEVRSKNEAAGHTPQPIQAPSSSSSTAPARRLPPVSQPAIQKATKADEEDGYYLHGRTYDGTSPPLAGGRTLAGAGPKKLESALDHFEEAMEREAEGNMGDSLKLYRQAYKLDEGVDRRYREKHFPKGFPKPAPPPSTTTPSNQQQPQQSQDGDQTPQPQSISDLLTGFSALSIQPTPPEIEGTPPPPCPISTLPDELLVHIMHDVAHNDVADFARLSLVCARMAFLVHTEQAIWRDISLGSAVGFAGMHHDFQLDIDWTPPPNDHTEEVLEDGTRIVVSARDLRIRRVAEAALVTRSLVPKPYENWKMLFRQRPRVRFNGCYISTVNYLRSGESAAGQATWNNNPIHIVTYYRYLRFFRDGSVISLLTTSGPSDVVHHLTKEELLRLRSEKRSHHGVGDGHGLPLAAMREAKKGRWRLSSTLDAPEEREGVTVQQPQEGDVYIETEGVGSKYIYRMDLSMRSAGKGARNNKLVWRGFYSYNKLTDDWGEFWLKNDKPFFFSRVKSYGFGE